MFSRLLNYIKGTKVELSHVNWPTKKQTRDHTLLVVAISISVALFLGFFDRIFTFLLQTFVL